ncbi:hypothetical protein D9756_011068 [Leucocoprinus leucothites]|uniref:Uncharacterized protein n=1 Tax=Leucocoprinus leucothites TaxID=201217 RepID=A0A8H5FPW3_9AGAR|nr:hypothetical protein D9756_011068 [Leucoagaricus leucothites]
MDFIDDNSPGCQPIHDWVTNVVSAIVIVGMSTAYAPQHYRIIKKQSSEGFSPLFLLLGSTSAAAGFWNMITMQWGVARCCGSVGWGSCVEMTAGIFQVFWQWFCFTLIFVLYIRYYPERLKYLDVCGYESRQPLKTSEWRFAQFCAWVTFGHLYALSPPGLSRTLTSSYQCVQWAIDTIPNEYRSAYTRPYHASSRPRTTMGYFPRGLISYARSDPVRAAADTHIPTQARGCVEYSDDVYQCTWVGVHDHQYRIAAWNKLDELVHFFGSGDLADNIIAHMHSLEVATT